MILRRCLASLVLSLVVTGGLACSSFSGSFDGHPDAEAGGPPSADGAADAKDARADSRADATTDAPSDAGVPFLVALSVTAATLSDAAAPVVLVPGFAPGIHDYSVRCASGPNALRVSMTASPGAESSLVMPKASPKLPEQTISPLMVREDQAIVAEATKGFASVEYWVRCLPHEFPGLVWDPHPEAGAPPPGYYLVGTFTAPAPSEPGFAMMLDGNGVPVWYFRQASGGVSDVDDVVDASVSFLPVDGRPAQVHQLSPYLVTPVAPKGVPLDFHELRALSNGNFLVISSPRQGGVDLTGLSVSESDGGIRALGPGSVIDACNLVEFDPKTGDVAWTWSATDHFDPAVDSMHPLRAGSDADGGLVVDAFHCNAIDVDPASGNILASARQMDSVFYIERSTGKVLWKMGGATDSLDHARYVPVPLPAFNGQHDARLQPGWSTCGGGQISLFDDESYGGGAPARGVVYDVSPGGGDAGCGSDGGGSDGGTASVATLSWQFVGKRPSDAEGSCRISADGSRVVGWGIQSGAGFTETDLQGHDLLDFRFTSNETYRAIKVPTTAFELGVLRQTAGHP